MISKPAVQNCGHGHMFLGVAAFFCCGIVGYGGRELPFTFFQNNYILISFKIN